MRILFASVVAFFLLPAVEVQAADCVQVDPAGDVYFTGEPIETCSGYALLTATDYAEFSTVLPLWTATDEEVQQAFLAGLSLPLIAYLVAWAFQIVINFATKDEGD